MITTSVVIQDETSLIEAGIWRKMDFYGEKIYVRIENREKSYPEFNIKGESWEAEMILERREAIALGHALISLGESL